MQTALEIAGIQLDFRCVQLLEGLDVGEIVDAVDQVPVRSQEEVKTQGQPHPNGTPGGGLLKGNHVLLLAEHPQIQHQHSQDETQEAGKKDEFVAAHAVIDLVPTRQRTGARIERRCATARSPVVNVTETDVGWLPATNAEMMGGSLPVAVTESDLLTRVRLPSPLHSPEGGKLPIDWQLEKPTGGVCPAGHGLFQIYSPDISADA